MFSRVETITPAIASEMLTKNIKNRMPKKKAIENYARDMKNGKWELSPQGISFYEDGSLADGQNRLKAIIKAGVPVDMYVTYDVPKTSTIHDRGVPRTTSDVLRMSGFYTEAASAEGVAVVNALFSYVNRFGVTDSIIEEFILEHHKAITAVVKASREGKLNGIARKAPLRAAMFCAMYCGIDEVVLAEFCEIVNTGFYVASGQTAAIVFRNYLLNEYTTRNAQGRKECFFVALNAIRDFSNHTVRMKRYRSDKKPPFWDVVKDEVVNPILDSYK